MYSNTSKSNLEMSLDLLVARASLDKSLRNELMHDAERYCIENGIKLPEGTKIVFTSAESHLIVKEIPILSQDNSTIQKIAVKTPARPTVGSGNEAAESEVIIQESVNAESSTQTNTAQSTVVEVLVE
tara:strand:+ start:888 stop:1271 length:384 start_codon:yes stop_codon:yes gene_type:complete